jgi:hypothetical protein
MEGFQVARCLAPSAIDDQILRVFCNLGIEVVEETAKDGFLKPTIGVQVGPMRGLERKGQVEHAQDGA